MPDKSFMRSITAIAASTLIVGFPAAVCADTPDLKQNTVLSGLESPWDMAFLPDGAMFFTEKCKGLSVRLPNGDVNNLLGMADTAGYASSADDLFCQGQAGMNGVTVDPDFKDNRTIYIYSASNINSQPKNRVLRLTVNEDLDSVSNRTDIVKDIPFKEAATDHPFGDAGAHNGGRIRFSPEGHLFVTTGDNHNSALPQSGNKLGSKVLRIDRNGEAVSGNAEATPDGFDPRIFTYGHRNVQGIAFHPETGQPIITEHGPWHSDEVNALLPGANSGWDPRPNMAGRGDCPDEYCGYQPNQNEGMDPDKRSQYMPMTDLETYPDAMKAIWGNNGLSQGISSDAFLTGKKWGDWNGDLVVSFLGIGFGDTPVGQRINVIDLEKDGDTVKVAEIDEMSLPEGSARVRSLVSGPNGDLFVAVDEGEIYRVTPQ